MTSLDELLQLDRPALVELSRKMHYYHVLDFGGGAETDGEFDLRPELAKYRFPEEMHGQRVLDIGRASGFFSFEFERRGAAVVSTDLPSLLDKDYVGDEWTRAVMSERRGGADGEQRADFLVAHKILQSKVESVYSRIYDLSPELFGGRKFDLVFVGSLLNHLASPVEALKKVRGVTGGRLIVANPFDPEIDQTRFVAGFMGRRARTLTTWWLPTVACMVEMLSAAGFARVEVVSTDVQLRHRPTGGVIPHFVIHADVATDPGAEIQGWRERLDASQPPTGLGWTPPPDQPLSFRPGTQWTDLCARLTAEVEAARAESARLRASLEDWRALGKRHGEDLETTRVEAERLRASLEDWRTLGKRHGEDLEAARAETERLRATLEDWRALGKKQTEKLAVARAEIAALRAAK